MAKENYKPIPSTSVVTEAEKKALKECNNQQLLLYNSTRWVYSQRWECNVVLLQTLTYYNTDGYRNAEYESLTEEINKGRVTSKMYSVLAVHSEHGNDIDALI